MTRTLRYMAVLALVTSPLLSALKIASNLDTIEYTPELVAAQDFYNGTAQIVSGGVPNLFSDSSVDLASNAETQALRNYNTHKNLRTIYTVAEVYYRIVARKDKGISTLKDLKGKRIGTIQSTSAAYFLSKYLATVGLKDTDYTIVSGSTCQAAPCASGTFPTLLSAGSIDALAMWEPSIEIAAQALGSNAVVFQQDSVYREVFNLHSTAEKLKDPAIRKQIVAYVKALTKAENVFTTKPESVYSRVASATRVNEGVLKAVWPIHKFNGTLAADLLDVLVEEDIWVAKVERRNPMTRADLTALVDPSVLQEALQS